MESVACESDTFFCMYIPLGFANCEALSYMEGIDNKTIELGQREVRVRCGATVSVIWMR